MEQARVDHGESVFEVNGMHGVEVGSHLESHEAGVALRVGIGEMARLHNLWQAVGIDVIVDAVGKEGHLCRQ